MGHLRSVSLGIAVGACCAVAASAIVFTILAVPIFVLASTGSGAGLDRDLVRWGLFYVAFPVGGLVGLVGGGWVARWYVRGGRLPTGRTPIEP